jgi:hypothetical protein
MMTTSAEFRQRARDCVVWASKTDDSAKAGALMSIARDWTMAAFIIDRQGIRVRNEVRPFQRAA